MLMFGSRLLLSQDQILNNCKCHVAFIEHGLMFEKAVWALGNMAGESSNFRDFVLQNGALFPLLAQLNEGSKISMLRNVIWTLSNFCREKPYAPFELVWPVYIFPLGPKLEARSLIQSC